ncbi:tubulin-tyrosine ligase family protein, putative [Ichthyophthirius multifiliis]|uniref:Tubulin-tyrosine ligase family protein, putative n=1 Tax=Ichthyophthirius multifiliis TaxID=5932 RepID=G0QLS8_ICHMU|nr:tubulin-tyrosine ligase family protein, putative [Ichthyophthirius multifiliis]EGR33829.1 tubulin-tyrosine ligase family protein, putative [Ichthyophthirius multifiliis]|eukprot:XP_004039053.1 tubulin-tyrosine ligase family protein, putative [Ichthyophthirius multifiliis]
MSIQNPNFPQNYSFKWKPTNSGINNGNIQKSNKKIQCLNHIINHSQLSQKAKLYNNIKLYQILKIKQFIKEKSDYVNNYLPHSFIFNLDSEDFRHSLDEFLDLFITIAQSTGLKNIWMLNPTDTNRGNGIRIFNDLCQFQQIMKEYGKKQIVENAINKITKQLDYTLSERYVRLSSEIYNINKQNLNNIYIHLTNNAIQKVSQNYGKYENGNIISYKQLEQALQEKYQNIKFQNILEQIQNLIIISIESCKKQLNKQENRFNFELFGYDFMIDVDGHVYLIEINSNPCLEESNDLLSQLIPRMIGIFYFFNQYLCIKIDDMFRLTIDKIFNQNYSLYEFSGQKSKLNQQQTPQLDFYVDGHKIYENLWQIYIILFQILLKKRVYLGQL